MAFDVTVNINDELEAVIDRLVANYNAGLPQQPITRAQMVRQLARDVIRDRARILQENDQAEYAAKRKRMSLADAAIVDAVLTRY